MATTVQEIQDRIASTLDQNSTITAGTDDWNLRLKFIQRAETEWSELYDWRVLYKEYNYLATSAVTQAMPSDFRRMAGYPLITYDLSTTLAFEEVKPYEAGILPCDRSIFYLTGSPNGGYTFISGRAISSGASVFIPYYTKGATLASSNSVSFCPNPDFLTWRAIAYWWEAREDPRADNARANAEVTKQQMLERENVPTPAQDGSANNVLASKHGFRVGRD